MPSSGDLHGSLRTLAALTILQAHAFQGPHWDWDRHFVGLRQLVASVRGVPEPRYRAPADASKPFRVIGHHLSPYFRDPRGALAKVRDRLVAGGAAAIVV